MKLNTLYVALVGAVMLVSYAVADPGRGHAYGHSQAGTSMGAASGAAGSGAQFTSGDGTAVLPFKSADEFFTPVGKVRTQGAEFVSAGAGQTASPKSDAGSQFLTSTSVNSNTNAGTGSAKTATSKPTSVIDAAAQKPDWVVNASSGGGPKPKPSPIPSATPGGAQSSPIPKPTGTPYLPRLTPTQPSIDPPPDI